MKHNPTATANAAAVTVGVFYILCRILVGIFPNLMFTFAEALLHGMALTQVGTWNLTLGSFTLGLIASSVSAWVIGYVFAVVYNSFVKK
jgi:hypothetical protein